MLKVNLCMRDCETTSGGRWGTKYSDSHAKYGISLTQGSLHMDVFSSLMLRLSGFVNFRLPHPVLVCNQDEIWR